MELREAVDRFRSRLTGNVLEKVAIDLGVSQRSLLEIECGMAEEAEMHALGIGFGHGPYPSRAVTFPERDHTGDVIGMALRAEDGRKGAPQGSKRGLVHAKQHGVPDPVVIVEGPSDALAGVTLHLATIGRASNSAGANILAEFPMLERREVVALADSDPAGISGAKKLAQELANRWDRPVPWTTLPSECKDLREYLRSLSLDLEDSERCAAAGVWLIDALRERAQLMQPIGLTQCIESIESRPLRWVLHPCIPQGKLGQLAGPPGLGKSLLTIDMAARLTRGRGLDGERTPEEPCDVLFLSAEDDPGDTIRPRLEAAGADLSRVHVTRCLDIDELAKMLDECPRVRLVVLDPLSAYVGHVDSHKDAEVRTLLARFAELASDRGVAILFVAHLKKSPEGDAITRPGGSIAFVAASRIAWIVLKDPRDAQRRLLLPLKNNLGRDAVGFAFRIVSDGADDPPRVAWDPERVTETADEVLSRGRPRAERAGRGEALEQACEFLTTFLAGGPRHAAEVIEGAEANAIGKPSLKRAKKKLGVIADKEQGKLDGVWIWSLPPDQGDGATTTEGDQEPPRAQDDPLREEA